MKNDYNSGEAKIKLDIFYELNKSKSFRKLLLLLIYDAIFNLFYSDMLLLLLLQIKTLIVSFKALEQNTFLYVLYFDAD